MNGQVSPFPPLSGSCLTAEGTVGHSSSSPRAPLGEAASWGRGEGGYVPGHQKSTPSLVSPIEVRSTRPSSFIVQARLPSPLLLQQYRVPGTVRYSA